MVSKTPEEIWEEALRELRYQVNKANFETWLQDTKGLAFSRDQFLVGAPTVFAAECLQKRLEPVIRRTLSRLLGREVEVSFEVHPSAEAMAEAPRPANSRSSPGVRPRLNGRYQMPYLNPRYTFPSFIEGKGNRVARAGALAVAEKPGQSYNPLFLYGGPGLGKTHLLHAIGHALLARNMSMLYVTGEQFVNDFVTGIKEGGLESLRYYYRTLDVLLLDDVQFLAGKEQSQEYLFHTFNDLHNANRQIVFTCDHSPKALTLLDERLRSRFEWGLIADLQPPDLETRLAILQAKAEERGAELPPEVLQLIARKVKRNIRELEGALNRVIAYVKWTRETLTVELGTQILQDFSPEPAPSSITPELVLQRVAEYYRLEPKLLLGPQRDQPVAHARQVVMYLLREETHRPLSEIGQFLGGRNHTTILRGWEKINNEIARDPRTQRDILELRESLHSL